jgi:hypothetical protein
MHNYLIAYVPDEKPVWVVAIIHRGRTYVIAAILRPWE